MQAYTLLVFAGGSESVVDNISESVTKRTKLLKRVSFERFEFSHFSVTIPWQNAQMLLNSSLHFPEIQVRCMTASTGAIPFPMNFFESWGCDLRLWVRHIHHWCTFTTSVTLRQLLLVLGSLSLFSRTFKVITWLYPEDSEGVGRI